jgi:hypothetical protein
MHRRQEHACGRRRSDGAKRATFQRAHVEVCEERSDEDEERVHAAERPVDRQRRGRRNNDGGDDPGRRPREPPAEVERERDGAERAEHG